MNPISRLANLWNVAMLFSLFLILDQMPIQAQDKSSKEIQQIKVFRLMSADAEVTLRVISTLMEGKECRLAIDARSNSIVAAGTNEDLQVIEALIMRLDENEKHSSNLIDLKHVAAEEIAQTLLQQFANTESVKIVVEPRKNALLVSGPDGTLKEVLDFVQAIDTPVDKGQLEGTNVLVYAYWIVDLEQAQQHFPKWKLREAPAAIQKLVVEKLAKRTHVKNPVMATNLAIQASIGESSRLSSEIQNSGKGKVESTTSYEFKVQGNLWNEVKSGDQVDMELQLQIGLLANGEKPEDSKVVTKIRTPLNHPVCLGMTPVNGIDSILVVEVVKAD